MRGQMKLREFDRRSVVHRDDRPDDAPLSKGAAQGEAEYRAILFIQAAGRLSGERRKHVAPIGAVGRAIEGGEPWTIGFRQLTNLERLVSKPRRSHPRHTVVLTDFADRAKAFRF